MRVFRIGEAWIAAESASEALRTNAALGAPLGTELLGADGEAVLARKVRLDLDGGYFVTWRTTSAWPDPVPPVDLESVLGGQEVSP